MKTKKKAATVWVAVKVWRGILVEAKAFHEERRAKRCETTWRKHLNLNNDDTGLFELTVK
jgi:hypothetical protein